MNRFAFAVLATACVAAAGVGGYLATRSAPAVAPAASASAPAAPPSATASAPAPAQAPAQTAVSPVASIPQDDTATQSASAAAAPPSVSRNPATRAVTPRAATPVRSASANAPREVPLSQRMPPASQAGAQPQPAGAPPRADDNSAYQPPQAPPLRPDDRAAELARPSEPPAKTYEELIIAPDSVLGLQIERAISTATARVEDRVDARVTRDVRVGEKIAIPAGTRAIGSVTEVEKGGKFKDRARLGIRFHTLMLADGTREPISTETIYRDGDPPEAAQKVGGGAVAGAILGAILGGAKGAAIGGAAGAGAGAAVTANGDKSAATFPAGTQTTVRILSPITITVER
jgi:hypothetical protein